MFQYQKLRNKKHFSKNIFSSDKKKKVGVEIETKI